MSTLGFVTNFYISILIKKRKKKKEFSAFSNEMQHPDKIELVIKKSKKKVCKASVCNIFYNFYFKSENKKLN